MFVAVRFPPRPGVVGDLRLLVQPTSRLREAGLIRSPRSVLDREGLYLAVTRHDGRFIWIVRIGDPRFVYAEYETRTGLKGHVFQDDSGVFSTRVPFDPGGSLELFEVGPTGSVTDVHFAESTLWSLSRAIPHPGGMMPVSWPMRDLISLLFAPLYSNLMIYYTADLAGLYRVAGNADPSLAINVLILGDGFVQGSAGDDLPSYRAAVERLVKRLLLTPPYCHYRNFVNFYRVDVADDQRLIPPGNCPTGCPGEHPGLPSHPGFVESIPAPLILGNGVLDEDFELTRCYQNSPAEGRCRVVWTGTSGQQKIADLIASYPMFSFPVAVLVGNAAEKVGAGWFDVSMATHRLAVLGVPMTPPAVVPPDAADPAATNLFAHELGHAFGLLDEYPNGSLDPAATPPTDRNVWRSGVRLPWPSGIQGTSDPIPWAGLLEPTCVVDDRVACCGLLDTSSDCQLCSEVPIPPDCRFVPAVCNRDRFTVCQNASGACAVPGTCPPTVDPRACPFPSCAAGVSLLEGALYSYEASYRAEFECRMDRDDKEFCDACLLTLGDHFHALGAPHFDPAQLGDSCLIWDGAVQVRVLDTSGAPIDGALITLTSVSMTRTMQTDDAGRARLIGLQPGPYVMTVTAPGHAPFTTEVIFTADGSTVLVVLENFPP